MVFYISIFLVFFKAYTSKRSGLLKGLTNEEPPHCDPTKKNALPTSKGDCGIFNLIILVIEPKRLCL